MRRWGGVVMIAVIICGLGWIGVRAGYEDYNRRFSTYTNREGENFSRGGIINLAYGDEPYIYFDTSETGKATVSVYRGDTAGMLDFITHDKDSKPLREVRTTNYIKVAEFEQEMSKTGDNKINLPIEGTGSWYVQVRQSNGLTTGGFINRKGVAVVVKEARDDLVFWLLDQTTGRVVAGGGQVTLYSALDQPRVLATAAVGGDGMAEVRQSDDADVAIVTVGGEDILVPLNLQYMSQWGRGNRFALRKEVRRSMVFTDRPLYRPGDKVYFKVITRSDDDASYSVPSGQVDVSLFAGWGNDPPVWQKRLSYSSQGSVVGELDLPGGNSAVGSYRLVVTHGDKPPAKASEYDYGFSGVATDGSAYFEVEYFRKPEYQIEIEIEKREVITGDKLTANISGSYFFGQPLAGKKVEVAVYSRTYSRRSYWDDDYGFSDEDWWWGYSGGAAKENRTVELDSQGKAVVELDTGSQGGWEDKLFSVEASFDDGSGNPVVDARNVLVHAAEFEILKQRTDWRPVRVGEEYGLPLRLRGNTSTNLAGRKLTVEVKLVYWEKLPLGAYEKYHKYGRKEETLPGIELTTDSSGRANFPLRPQKAGSYTIGVTGTDDRGNKVRSNFYVWVMDEAQPYFSNGTAGLVSLQADKEEYLPGETVSLSLWSGIANRDMLLTVERGYTRRYQTVSITGNSKKIQLPLEAGDVPNTIVKAAGFSPEKFEQDEVQLKVSARDKKLEVKLSPDAAKYGPGQTATVKLDIANSSGRSVPTEAAIWVVDKAIYELAGDRTGNVFERFWATRYNQTATANSLEDIFIWVEAEMGGCFAPGTLVSMPGGKTKKIEEIKPGDKVASWDTVAGKQLATAVKTVSKKSDNGWLVINLNLRVTPDHLVMVNGRWRTAGDIQVGDWLTGINGLVEVTSVEYQQAAGEVYNLELADNPYFFADGVLVHNDKGDGRTTRSTFKDTAYWNGRVYTGDDGKAVVSFKLPDNLTTWVVAAVAVTPDTYTGQATTEIVVTKDLISRPFLPNFTRGGDKVIFTGQVHNFSQKAQEVSVTTEYPVAKFTGEKQLKAEIEPGGYVTYRFPMEIEKSDEKAKFTLYATASSGLADRVILDLPAKKFGFSQKKGEAYFKPGVVNLPVPPDVDKTNSTLQVFLAANSLGAIPEAMKYLLDYPYGCVEQITSRLVPAIMAKTHPGLFAQALQNVDVDKNIRAGLEMLADEQTDSGGWGWWSEPGGNPFITAYVVRYLVEAAKAGVAVDERMQTKVVTYLMNLKEEKPEVTIPKYYALGLLSHPDGQKPLEVNSSLPSDLLALAVMHNIRMGIVDPQKSGWDILIGHTKQDGGRIYWEEGDTSRFGSKEASTGLVLQALAAVGGQQELGRKLANQLHRGKTGYYWHNSFATVQVIAGILDFFEQSGEADSNYSYAVKLNGQVVKTGKVTDALKLIPTVDMDTDKLGDVNRIEVSQGGEGQLYFTVVRDWWRTDKQAGGDASGIKLTRRYESEKGPEYSIAVGDVVNVTLEVAGVGRQDLIHLVAEDKLPSGLVAINNKLDNEKRVDDDDYYYWTHRKFTDEGVVLSKYWWEGADKFTYKARAVSAGEYWAPPATAELMYEPTVNSTTTSDRVTIDETAQYSPMKSVGSGMSELVDQIQRHPLVSWPVFIGLTGGLVGLGWWIVKKRRENKLK